MTPKKEKFAQKYLELGNASEAYRQSYNAENMSESTVWNEASKLLKNPEVAARVEEGQEKARKLHEVTLESITKELEEARLLAVKEKQSASAVSASMGKAKLHGLVTDKKEIKVSPLEAILDDIDGQSTGLPEN